MNNINIRSEVAKSQRRVIYPDEGQTSSWLEVDLKKPESFNVVSFVEPVGGLKDYAQSRTLSYRFLRWDGARWVTLAEGGKPSPVTLHKVARVTGQRVRLELTSSENQPQIAEIGIYSEAN